MVQHADIDHTGLTGTGGSVATDSIWDAAGDLAVGSGANTAARLALGATNGMALRRVSDAVAWALPPGHELDYVEITSDVNVTGTSEGAATTIITGTSQAYAAIPTMIEFFSPDVRIPTNAIGDALIVLLYDGASLLGRFAVRINSAAQSNGAPIFARYRLTPTAATHQYIIKATVTNATGTPRIGAGAGGSGTSLPAYIRVTVA